MEVGFTTNGRVIPILLIGIVGMILITSQVNSAFAGFEDYDNDGIPIQDPCSAGDAAAFNCDPDDSDPCNPDPSTHACLDRFLKLIEEVEDLIGDVEDLVEEGDLEINNGQLNAILGKLETAVDKIESENINAAVGALNAFINQINAFINAGSITPQDAQALIVAAQNIINSL